MPTGTLLEVICIWIPVTGNHGGAGALLCSGPVCGLLLDIRLATVRTGCWARQGSFHVLTGTALCLPLNQIKSNFVSMRKHPCSKPQRHWNTRHCFSFFFTVFQAYFSLPPWTAGVQSVELTNIKMQYSNEMKWICADLNKNETWMN